MCPRPSGPRLRLFSVILACCDQQERVLGLENLTWLKVTGHRDCLVWTKTTRTIWWNVNRAHSVHTYLLAGQPT